MADVSYRGYHGAHTRIFCALLCVLLLFTFIAPVPQAHAFALTGVALFWAISALLGITVTASTLIMQNKSISVSDISGGNFDNLLSEFQQYLGDQVSWWTSLVQDLGGSAKANYGQLIVNANNRAGFTSVTNFLRDFWKSKFGLSSTDNIYTAEPMTYTGDADYYTVNGYQVPLDYSYSSSTGGVATVGGLNFPISTGYSCYGIFNSFMADANTALLNGFDIYHYDLFPQYGVSASIEISRAGYYQSYFYRFTFFLDGVAWKILDLYQDKVLTQLYFYGTSKGLGWNYYDGSSGGSYDVPASSSLGAFYSAVAAAYQAGNPTTASVTVSVTNPDATKVFTDSTEEVPMYVPIPDTFTPADAAALTQTAVLTGESATTSGGESGGSIPLIVPETTGIASIWHYVTDTFEYVGDFFTLIASVFASIPLPLMTLGYAVIVLAIVFGVFKKFIE